MILQLQNVVSGTNRSTSNPMDKGMAAGSRLPTRIFLLSATFQYKQAVGPGVPTDIHSTCAANYK